MNFSIHPSSLPSSSLIVFPFEESETITYEFNGKSHPVKPAIFKGKKDHTYLLDAGNHLHLLVGLGKNPDHKALENSFRKILSQHEDLIASEIVLVYNSDFKEEWLTPSLTGFLLGTYHLDHFKKKKKSSFEELQVSILTSYQTIEPHLNKAQKIASAKIESFRLVDLPPNQITPEYLADWSKKLSEKEGVNVKILDQKKAKKERLDAFLAVGRGSNKPAQFIIIEYRPDQADKHIGLVGKGVTFDTGGLNIKTQNMHIMKSDMGGAAAVLGASQLIIDLELPINLTTIVPAVENAVSEQAFLPSEVIGSHAGLSIEVVDTDAEGRLILADSLSYLIQNYDVNQVLDFATLTGSALGTFGYECAALFSNDDSLLQAIQDAGDQIGEKAWPLPLWEAYGKEMDSEIADIRNYHGKPYAGAITAAKFLQAFTHQHPSWAHLDIAGVAFANSDFAKSQTGTGYGIELILRLIENHFV